MPPKSISVPLNPAARGKQRSRAVAELASEGAVDNSPAAAPRKLQPQPMHRFRVGERLRMVNGGHAIARADGYCKVLSLLPYEGHGSLLYRVRSDAEAFERVVAEADLSRV